MDSTGDGSNPKLPPPPAGLPGKGQRTIADVVGESHTKGAAEGPEVKKLKQTAIQKYTQMKRPGFGQKGRKVDLICNHFKVTFKPSEPVFHYNVVIEPESRSVVKRKVMAALHATYGQEFLKGKRFAYDGENSLFTVGALSLKRNEFPVLLEDELGRGRGSAFRAKVNPKEGPTGSPEEAPIRSRPGREFTVLLAHVATIDMKAIESVLAGERNDKVQDALRVLDIMLREHAAKRDYLLLKESYFHPSIGDVQNIGDGVVMWRGFHVSFRPTSGGLSLNFDLSTTLLIQPVNVLKFVQEHCKKQIQKFNAHDWLRCKAILKGVMVKTYSERKHRITGFSPETCARQTFLKRTTNTDGSTLESVEVTVANYFEERGVNLQHPHLPALNVGKSAKPVYLPIELCDILPGQRYKRALTTMQRQAQIDHTRQQPDVRQRLIQKVMDINQYNEDDLVKEFNVNIDRNMKRVQGRVLDSPKLLFGNRFEEVPRNGRWNFGGRTMKKPVEIPNWAVCCFRGRVQLDAHKIATEMKAVCSQKGMKLGDFVLVEEEMSMRNEDPTKRVRKVVEEIGKKLSKCLSAKSYHEKPFILAILPEKSPDLYIPFKRQCEVEIGIVTQCIVPPKGGINPKYLTSVSLKINLKRGGYNSVLSAEELKTLPRISQVPTIIFGLDVSHGSPGDASSPSVAAAVATVDWPHVSRFTTSIRAQEAKTEMIRGLYETEAKGMVRELLMNFYKFEDRNIKPHQILIFRDGVSESQFDQVLETELVAFKMACMSLNKAYNPKITMIVVQKRHHTRFFPANSQGNVVPGTIVDRDPCHPGNNDFYLCSHAGIIGTSRPTHYHVLYDEIGFTPDELQHITNSLCYSYTRCTSAVSVVAPAYYAHLAAQHCRNFVVDNYDSSSDSSKTSERIAKAVASLPTLKDDVMKKMFYA